VAHKIRSVVLRVKKACKKYKIVSGKDVEVFNTERACQSALNQIVTQWKAYGIQRLVVVIGDKAWAYKRNADGSYSIAQIPVPRRKAKKKKKTTVSEVTASKPKRKRKKRKVKSESAQKSTAKATTKKPAKRKKRKARKSKSRAKTVVAALPSPSSVPRNGAAAEVHS